MAEYAVQCGAKFIVKGVRDAADMVVETQMYYANREASQGAGRHAAAADAGGVCLPSSSIVRDVASYGGDISAFVPPCYFGAGGQGLSEGIKKLPLRGSGEEES